jgi:hypothetical protein
VEIVDDPGTGTNTAAIVMRAVREVRMAQRGGLEKQQALRLAQICRSRRSAAMTEAGPSLRVVGQKQAQPVNCPFQIQ